MQDLDPKRASCAFTYLSWSQYSLGNRMYSGESKEVEYPSINDQKFLARLHFYLAINSTNKAFESLRTISDLKDILKEIKICIAVLNVVQLDISKLLIRDIYDELLSCSGYYKNNYSLNDSEIVEIVRDFCNSNKFHEIRSNLLGDCDQALWLISQFEKLNFIIRDNTLPYPLCNFK